MKKLIIVFMTMLILCCGCNSSDTSTADAVTINNPIPTQIDLKDFHFTFDGYSVAEFCDSVSYKTVIDIKIVFDDSFTEKDIYWITKDDLDIFVDMTGENDKLNLYDGFGGKLDILESNPSYTIYENTVYYSHVMQYEGRYSVENADLTIMFNYYDGESTHHVTFFSNITADTMLKINQYGDTDAGITAQKYLDEKSKILGIEPMQF